MIFQIQINATIKSVFIYHNNCVDFIIIYNNGFLYILGIIYFTKGSTMKYPRLIINNYEYQIHIHDVGKTRWRCRWHQKLKCRAIIYTSGKTVFINSDHNHAPLGEIDCRNLTGQLVTFVRNKIK